MKKKKKNWLHYIQCCLEGKKIDLKRDINKSGFFIALLNVANKSILPGHMCWNKFFKLNNGVLEARYPKWLYNISKLHGVLKKRGKSIKEFIPDSLPINNSFINNNPNIAQNFATRKLLIHLIFGHTIVNENIINDFINYDHVLSGLKIRRRNHLLHDIGSKLPRVKIITLDEHTKGRMHDWSGYKFLENMKGLIPSYQLLLNNFHFFFSYGNFSKFYVQ